MARCGEGRSDLVAVLNGLVLVLRKLPGLHLGHDQRAGCARVVDAIAVMAAASNFLSSFYDQIVQTQPVRGRAAIITHSRLIILYAHNYPQVPPGAHI